MATAEKINLKDPVKDAEQARALAARYRCEFVDLREAHIDHDLFHSVPVDLMFRYNFVPMHASEGTLEIALADPRNLNMIDELAMILQKKLKVRVATLAQISDLLKKTERELMDIKNFGKKSADEVIERLKAYGFSMAKDKDEELANAD